MAENDGPLDGLLTKQGLSKKLQCSIRTIDNMIAAGKLPVVRLGGRGGKLVRFDWEAVKARLVK